MRSPVVSTFCFLLLVTSSWQWENQPNKDFKFQCEKPIEYTVSVLTGNDGTNAQVFLELFGSLGKSQKIALSTSTTHTKPFQAYQRDVFKVESLFIGEISQIHIWHDNTGSGPSWKLESVEVTDGEREYKFPVASLLDVAHGGLSRKVAVSTAPPLAHGCEFTQGRDGIGGSEKNIGAFNTMDECINACYEKGGNGVTIPVGGTTSVSKCFCESGQKEAKVSGAYKNCFLDSVKGDGADDDDDDDDNSHQAWTEPLNYGCEFVESRDGDGSESNLGRFPTINACLDACYKTGGNGVTLPVGDVNAVSKCYCEKGQTGLKVNSRYKNCVLKKDVVEHSYQLVGDGRCGSYSDANYLYIDGQSKSHSARWIYTDSVSCQMKCDEHPECTYFTAQAKYCLLWTAATCSPSAYSSYKTYKKMQPKETSYEKVGWGRCAGWDNENYILAPDATGDAGHAIRVSMAVECQARCDALANCKYYTTKPNHWCYLWSAANCSLTKYYSYTTYKKIAPPGPESWGPPILSGPNKGRCGLHFNAKCSIYGNYPCCSSAGWCGSSKAHCECKGCTDFKKLASADKPCVTVAGKQPGKPCVFPFNDGEEVRNRCVPDAKAAGRLWCPTKVDSAGNPVPGYRGFCQGECSAPSPVAITGIHSIFRSGDRQWKFDCQPFPGTASTCKWTEWQNDKTGELDFTCPLHNTLTGFAKSNGKYKFQCCYDVREREMCYTTGYKNIRHGNLNYVAPATGSVQFIIRGMKSIMNGDDRKWKFHVCELDDVGDKKRDMIVNDKDADILLSDEILVG